MGLLDTCQGSALIRTHGMRENITSHGSDFHGSEILPGLSGVWLEAADQQGLISRTAVAVRIGNFLALSKFRDASKRQEFQM